MAKAGSYDGKQIKVLEGLEAVRKRPGMYIGSTGIEGLHHLAYEIADNSVDEALGGHCDHIWVSLGHDGDGDFLEVKDNGRGIPFDKHPQKRIPTVRVVMEILHAGGKFGGEGSGYKVSGGLHGVGISVVNALSKKVEVFVVRDRKKYSVSYRDGGKFVSDSLKDAPKGNVTGTYVRFWPDDTILDDTVFDFDKLVRRFRKTAFLTPSVTITVRDNRPGQDGQEEVLHYSNGLSDYIDYLTSAERKLTAKGVVFISDTANAGEPTEVAVDAALTYVQADNDPVLKFFTNNIHNPDGGTHEAGFKSAVTRALNEHGKAASVFKAKDKPLSQEDVRDGMFAVVSVKMEDPQFEGQTKSKLGSAHVQGAVTSVVYAGLRRWMEDNPAEAKAIIQKCIQSQKAREHAKKAAEVSRKRKGLDSAILDKLDDCNQRTPALERELFLVEGDSAGGSAKSARHNAFQAVLPLRGKIINAERGSATAILKNAEVQAIIEAIGAGYGKAFDPDQVRYGKVVIMTDADVDGDHIRTLLLTLFFREFRRFVDDGRLWVARPPLFMVSRKGRPDLYLFSQGELKKELAKRGPEPRVQRFKGLGEMDPIQLQVTTMDPETRFMQRIVIEDEADLEDTITMLMGEKRSDERREFVDHQSVLHPPEAE